MLIYAMLIYDMLIYAMIIYDMLIYAMLFLCYDNQFHAACSDLAAHAQDSMHFFQYCIFLGALFQMHIDFKI